MGYIVLIKLSGFKPELAIPDSEKGRLNAFADGQDG
jgi:hypothetical protein